uniref:TonB-dependent receptor plug domain-containing protein n=1 Tax=Sandarakinorhabdus sp. TaxID=1916663 RepID=UPI00286EA204
MLAVFILAAQASTITPALPADADVAGQADIVTVTASREPAPASDFGTTLTIIDRGQIEALSLPMIKDYLTLVPSVSVSQTGPMGAQTQIRIRGAEANHSITFIDGIEVNDPSSSGEFRYETLLAQGVERIEVLRGPQSALWGSQAIGGVINISTRRDTGLYGEAQGGSLGTVRGGIGGGFETGGISVSGQASAMSSSGYDIAGVGGGGGDRDGYENVTLHGRVSAAPTDNLTLSVVSRFTSSESRFDGFNFGAGVPVDRPLATRTRQVAVRAAADLSLLDGAWTQTASYTHTNAANINRNGPAFQNRSDGGRDLFRFQSSGRLDTGTISHRLTLAVDHERERFTSTDANPLAQSNQSRRRVQTSLVGEYRLTAADWLSGGVAVRRDLNDRFADATTVRADAVVRPGGGFNVHASYGTGIADPTFFELFGFFPGSFIGNPDLVPERSRSWD